MKLYYFPLSSYSQKVLTALYEKDVPFTPEIVSVRDPVAAAAYKANVNMYGKVPTLVLDDGWKIPESSIIIEYLDSHFGGTRLIAEDKDLARQTRFHDRMFDLYVNNPMTTIFFDGRKAPTDRNPAAVAAARETLETSFAGYDKHFASRTWAMGDAFSMADCAAAPALAYCRMLHPFDKYKNLAAYAGRLMERPSFARVSKEAAPFLAAMMQQS